jgi:hypothetical protein
MSTLRTFVLILLFVLPVPLSAAEQIPMTLYKNPECGCCEGHAAYLRERGYAVTVLPTHDLSLIRQRHGVSAALAGCHTIIVGPYVVEGHVSAQTIGRLLTERPDIRGISMPGMPAGSPGMSGQKTEPFVIYEISDGPPKVYAVE